ncbi:MAG: hypothetical protein Q9193_006933, partial [Seirophora villosa]
NGIAPSNADPTGDPPHNTPPPGNRQGLHSQDNSPPSDTSPGNESEENGAQDSTAPTRYHGMTNQERQRHMQPTVEDDDGSSTPEHAGHFSRVAPVRDAGRALPPPAMVQDRMLLESASASIHPQTLAEAPPPGSARTPVVGGLRPTSSPSSRASQDARGMDSLLAATQATQLPDPLRLTARPPDQGSLFRTLDVLFAMPHKKPLSCARRGDIMTFVGSLFDAASYWTLRTHILRQVERTGFRTDSATGLNLDRRDSIASFDSSRTPSVDSRSDSGVKAPPLLTMLAEQWRGFVHFSHQTSTLAAVRLTKMKQEEQCYLHWCTLQAIWKASDPGRDQHGNHDHHPVDDSGGDDDEALPPPAHVAAHLEYADPAAVEGGTAQLLQFLIDQMEQRKSELNLRLSPQYEAHTVPLLKALVAPFLGLTSTENLWRKTMTIGRGVHAVVRELGSGALAVVKRESIRCLGPEMLERILPTINANHPELTQILQTVERVYLQPLRGPDPRLRSEDVAKILRIDGIARLKRECGLNANGLNGILGAQPHDVEPSSAGRLDLSPPSSEQPPDDPLADIDEACYSIAELLGPDPDRPSPPPQPNDPPPAELPTPPPTAERRGGKRKVGPEREESPTKRLARGGPSTPRPFT